MHLTEGRNTGFRKILNALKQNGSPNPIFETDPARLSFSTTLLIHPDFKVKGFDEGEFGANGANLAEGELLVLEYIRIHSETSTKEMANNYRYPCGRFSAVSIH